MSDFDDSGKLTPEQLKLLHTGVPAGTGLRKDIQELKEKFRKLGFEVLVAGPFVMIPMVDAQRIVEVLKGQPGFVEKKGTMLRLVTDNDKAD